YEYAVKLASGFANRLVLHPDAIISGVVFGGNSLGSGIESRLELESAASTGTLSGLGSQFQDFAQIRINPGASWTWSSNNTLATGMTLTNGGNVSGVIALTGAATVSNRSTGTITSDSFGVSGSGAGATVVNAGGAILATDPTSSIGVVLNGG